MRNLLFVLLLTVVSFTSKAQCPKVVEVATNFGMEGTNSCAVAVFDGDIPGSGIPELFFSDGTNVTAPFTFSNIDAATIAQVEALRAALLALMVFPPASVNSIFDSFVAFLNQYFGDTASLYSEDGFAAPPLGEFEALLCLFGGDINSPQDPLPYDDKLSSVENLMPISCSYSNGLLPVVLTSFELVRNTNSISVQWSTSFEYQNSHFNIQRSANAIDWLEIGSVSGRANYDGNTDYQYIDKFPLTGTNYYRLVDVDFEGKENFSELRQVDFEPNTIVYPNPASSSLTISGEFKLYDSYGRFIRQGTNEEIDVTDYPAGMYIVKIHHSVEKVLIQN